jgi:zinc transport system permease protein
VQEVYILYMDDFIIRALLAGVAVALATGPLGCFIMWKKMAFFGDAISHSAILGVAVGLVWGIDISISIIISALVFSLFIHMLNKEKLFTSDAVLGLITSGAMACGLIIIAVFVPAKFNILNLLFGDILATSYHDIIIMYTGSFLVISGLIWIWKPLLLATINEDLARVEGVNVPLISLIFTAMVALIVALCIKIVVVLLVSSLLIMPACIARIFSKTPENMAVFASVFGVIAIFIGIYFSLKMDTPAGPSMVVALLVIFGVARSTGVFCGKR